jgi:hypothetical protein
MPFEIINFVKGYVFINLSNKKEKNYNLKESVTQSLYLIIINFFMIIKVLLIFVNIYS